LRKLSIRSVFNDHSAMLHVFFGLKIRTVRHRTTIFAYSGLRAFLSESTLLRLCSQLPYSTTYVIFVVRLLARSNVIPTLGLLTPFLTNVKIFVQDLWAKQLAWDDPLDASDRQRWSELREELKSPLPTIPRLVVSRKATSDSSELCVFGDASKRVYACCAYLLCRSQSASSSRLVMAKSHLNDFKPITIPRSELLAVHISVRLAQYVVNQLDINISSVYVFSDSQIALHWIHSSRQFKTFVQNRVKAIKDIVASFRQRNITTKFHYVASQDNLADCATRGLSTKDSQGHIWWSGPSFLLSPPSQ
uniref:RNase H domain-containing protein n=1 Tax=Haemonchus placei TaxID=6290 RepID=A0A0N4X8N9_HAEPC